MNLILFSASFPFVKGGDANFLSIEIQHLLRVFERVIIVPETLKAPQLVDYPGLEAVTQYAELLASQTPIDLFRLALSSRLFFQGFSEKNFYKSSFTAWRRLTAFVGKAELLRRWLLEFLHKENLAPQDCLYYTYWFDNAAAGIGLIKEQYPGVRIVSRAHNYDVYEELYYRPPFFPCRNFSLNALEKLFPCSINGVEYMQKRYPQYGYKFQSSLLGVADPGFLAKRSVDGVFRIVSCSFFRPEKRIPLLLDALVFAAKKRPDQRIEWFHIGNGKEKDVLQEKAKRILPSSVKEFFIDYIDNQALMDFYKNNPVDVFINVSSTEGIPVSIMEASSCGIPIIATAVGGNTEIVSPRNGYLLSPTPSLEEISSACFHLMDNPAEAEVMRAGSRQMWQSHYNADVNFPEFAHSLRSIRLGKTNP